MLYTRQAALENIRNREGKRVFYLGKGDQLTSEARDYLSRERIPILPAEQAKPERYQLLSGGTIESKPEQMTHLNGQILVPKTHPRIAFRGGVDLLEAQLLLCQSLALEPMDDNPDDSYVILKLVTDENGEEVLVTIDDDDEFDRVADTFEDTFMGEIDLDEAESNEE